jgi:hypothetical protein
MINEYNVPAVIRPFQFEGSGELPVYRVFQGHDR